MIETVSKTSDFPSQKNQQEAKNRQRNSWRLNSLYQTNLFTISQFLNSEFCTQLQAEIHQSPFQPARVIGRNNQPGVDRTIRKTDEVQISLHYRKTIKDYLVKLKPQLEQHFKTSLSEIQGPRILRYHQGDFFHWHTDTSNHRSTTKDRKVTSLVYLNESNEESESDGFVGGELEIYIHDLIPQEEYREYCLQLSAKTGQLIAFNSQIHHQVQPIVRGERYVIVAHWK